MAQQLEPGGEFSYRIEAKDGSERLDFSGVYEIVIPKEEIVYLLDDGRKVSILFSREDHETFVSQTFDAEDDQDLEDQEEDWQAILDNFKKHTEAYFK